MKIQKYNCFVRTLRLTSLALIAIFVLSSTLVAAKLPTPAQASSRIIGGAEVPSGKYPWMVALLDARALNALGPSAAQFCGGTLVAPNWVVTAAHCVDLVEASAFMVGVGSVDLNGTDLALYRVSKIIGHPSFVRNGSRDIALIRLGRSVPADIEPVRLAAPGEVARIGTSTQVIGWGRADVGVPSAKLMEARLRIARNVVCDPSSTYLTPNDICAISPTETTGICFGDSGGPIILTDEATGEPVQIGISSLVFDACHPTSGQAFADIAGVVRWIRRQIREDGRNIDISADMTMAPAYYCQGLRCYFDASFVRQYGPSRPIRYAWRFDGGRQFVRNTANNNNMALLTHRFRTPGTHQVDLVINYDNGQRLKKRSTIKIKSSGTLKDRYRRVESRREYLTADGDVKWFYELGGTGTFFYNGLAEFTLIQPDNSFFNFSLYKYDFSGDLWRLIAVSSDANGHSRIRRNLSEGYYAVRATSLFGSGYAELRSKVWRSRRDVCLINGFIACRLDSTSSR